MSSIFNTLDGLHNGANQNSSNLLLHTLVDLTNACILWHQHRHCAFSDLYCQWKNFLRLVYRLRKSTLHRSLFHTFASYMWGGRHCLQSRPYCCGTCSLLLPGMIFFHAQLLSSCSVAQYESRHQLSRYYHWMCCLRKWQDLSFHRYRMVPLTQREGCHHHQTQCLGQLHH